MQPTTRYWTAVGVGLVLVATALVAARPLLFVPAAAVFAYLLGAQVAFLAACSRFDASLTVTQSFDRRATSIDVPATLVLSAEAEAGSLDVTVRPRFSSALPASTPSAGLGEPLSVEVPAPIAGTHDAFPPTFLLADPAGLFSQRLRRGPTATLRVEPPGPSRIHVGQGGDTLPGAFGEHESDFASGGVVPAEIREYVPGESMTRIDWKTTARLAALHVREYGGGTDRPSVLVVDARRGLDVGPEGETAMTYLRDAALRYLASSRSLTDPVGCYVVNDDGVRQLAAAKSSPQHYERVRQQLVDLVVEDRPTRRQREPPLAARGVEFDRTTTFGDTLSRFVTARPAAAETPAPLSAAVRSAVNRHQGAVQIALFTDDADRAGVREAIAEARRHDTSLTAFLAPRVLFEPGALADREVATERFLRFERFRRDLERIDGVRAFEVAPEDRIDALLEGQPVPGSTP